MNPPIMDPAHFNTTLVLKNLAFLMKFSFLSILLLVPEYHSLRPNKTNDPAVNNCQDVILEHLSSDTSAAVQTLCKHCAVQTLCKHFANTLHCVQSANTVQTLCSANSSQPIILSGLKPWLWDRSIFCLFSFVFSHWLQCKYFTCNTFHTGCSASTFHTGCSANSCQLVIIIYLWDFSPLCLFIFHIKVSLK